MAKWFVTSTVFALCFLGVFAQNDTSNTTYPDELILADITDEPTYSPTKLQSTKDDHIESMPDEDVGKKRSYTSSTFPPLVHSADPHQVPVTEKPPKISDRTGSIDVTQNNSPTTTPTSTTEAATSKPATKQAEKNKNTSNVHQGSLIVLVLCLLVSRSSF